MEFPAGMRRIALGVEYAGAEFNGFQRQVSTSNTVQGKLEFGLSRIANEPITLVCAGRTDAGVHATGQIVHFDTYAERPDRAWIEGVNTKMPAEVRVHWVKEVGPSFHARFSATSRVYRYVIHATRVRSALLRHQVSWVTAPLELALMAEAGASLVGRHDFSAYRAAQCQSKSPVREIESLRFFTQGPLIVMEIKANAFLHHMVRNIAGVMIEIGKGVKPVSWAAELLAGRDRSKAAMTASPFGLYLVDVTYPQCFDLPQMPLGPVFLNC
jgi:pseudouridylate synthase I